MVRTLLARVLVTSSLVLGGLTVAVTPAHANVGLSVTARYALLGGTPQTVVLVGRYTCGPFTGGVADRGVVDLTVRQGADVTGFGYLEPTVCTGLPQRYAVELTSYGAGFTVGPAEWTASGYLEADGGFWHFHQPPTALSIH